LPFRGPWLFLTAKRFRRPARGCRFGYPGIKGEKAFNRKAVAPQSTNQNWRNRVAVGITYKLLLLLTQGSPKRQPWAEGWNRVAVQYQALLV